MIDLIVHIIALPFPSLDLDSLFIVWVPICSISSELGPFPSSQAMGEVSDREAFMRRILPVEFKTHPRETS